MEENVKMCPVRTPPMENRFGGSSVIFDNNSILFGYTIRIPKEVYDNSLRCSRSSKIVNEINCSKDIYGKKMSFNVSSLNSAGTIIRQRTGRCYYKIELRKPFRQVQDLYQMSNDILTVLKQISMIKARLLKELNSENERESLMKGEMTTKQVNKQLELYGAGWDQ